MKRNMLAVFILVLVIANLVISSITLMVVMPNLKNTNDFIAKVAAAIELEELENNQEVGLEQMETYVLTKSSESIVINLKSYESQENAYVVIKGISLTLNTKAADYGKVKKLLDIDLIDKYSYRNKAMIELMYATGLRVSELINIKINDIDIDSCIVKTLGKGSKERIIPIGEYAILFLIVKENNMGYR